jgi:hypothetical protein
MDGWMGSGGLIDLCFRWILWESLVVGG